MKCFVCEGYFKYSHKSRSNECNACIASVGTNYLDETDVEFQVNTLKGSGRTLPVFDNSEVDFDFYGYS